MTEQQKIELLNASADKREGLRVKVSDKGEGEGIWGCTDSLADNYDAEATHDNGTCIYSASSSGTM